METHYFVSDKKRSPIRFSILQRGIAGISKQMLTKQLRELEKDENYQSKKYLLKFHRV